MAKMRCATILTSFLLLSMMPLAINTASATEEIPPSGISDCGFELDHGALLIGYGYDKIYNSSNPFDFMELISVESKVNFFERTNAEYALANKTVDQDVFDFDTGF